VKKREKKGRSPTEQDALELTRISEGALKALSEIQDALSEDATDEAKEIAERVITEINNGLNKVADARVRRYLETRRGA
jgi:histone H3/H4